MIDQVETADLTTSALDAVPPTEYVGTKGTESKRRMVQLDFVRGIAILMVMAHHFISWPIAALNAIPIKIPGRGFGWVGVDLFFVLSGFLVGGLLIGEIYRTGSLRIGRFIKRRGFKIWPAYYVYLLFQLVTRHFPPSTFLIPNLLHLQNYLGTSLQHTWTLAVEEHFYLVLPFLLVWIYSSPIRRANAPKIFISIGILVLAIRSFMVLALGSTKVGEYTHTRLDSLMFGVLLSHFYYFHRDAFDRFTQKRLLLSSVVAAGLLFLFLTDAKSKLMLTVGYTMNYLCFAALMLLMIGVTGNIVKSLPYRMIAAIGVYSYSIYLWHNSVRTPLLHLCSHLPANDELRWFSLWVAQYLCAIVLGVLMARMIEWPFLRFREKVVPA
jgi:peptidoglycan/LPS O-acetylase OafA/YrhL